MLRSSLIHSISVFTDSKAPYYVLYISVPESLQKTHFFQVDPETY